MGGIGGAGGGVVSEREMDKGTTDKCAVITRESEGHCMINDYCSIRYNDIQNIEQTKKNAQLT